MIARRCGRVAASVLCSGLVLSGALRGTPVALHAQAARPNIVLIFPDNLGWGEVGVYGGVRGPVTPRIDRMAAEGIRLNAPRRPRPSAASCLGGPHVLRVPRWG